MGKKYKGRIIKDMKVLCKCTTIRSALMKFADGTGLEVIVNRDEDWNFIEGNWMILSSVELNCTSASHLSASNEL